MNILINVVIIIIALLPALLFYLKERRCRREAEKMLRVVRLMGEIDDRIFRIRMDDPEDWPASREAQMLIVHRIRLHEEYSAFLGHQLLRDCEYMNGLMGSVISK